jgi:hypothetical protein
MDAVYLPFLVSPPQLRDFFLLAGAMPISGFSVTIPHKQKIIRYLDIVDPLAKRIGAVNTVWRKAGKWRGTNTDIAGVLGPLSKHVRLAQASADRRQRAHARGGLRALRCRGARVPGRPQSGRVRRAFPRSAALRLLREPAGAPLRRPRARRARGHVSQ